MPIVEERQEVQPIALGEHGSGEWSPEYVIRDAASEWEAWQALALHVAAIPQLTVGQETLVRGPIQITERLGQTLWQGRVTWRSRQSQSELLDRQYAEFGPEGFTWQLSTMGGRKLVTQALEDEQGPLSVVYRASGGPSASDRNGVIGAIDDSGRPEGVEIEAPVLEWSETHRFPAAAITFDYVRQLYLLTGSVNRQQWREFGPVEVLFRGASGGQQSTDWAELTFSFAFQPTTTDLTIGDISGIEKRGWEYLWVLYEPVEQPEETDAPRIIAKPAAVYLEAVYPDRDFALLGIGG